MLSGKLLAAFRVGLGTVDERHGDCLGGALPSCQFACPSQCSCTFNSLSGGAKSRVVLCNDPEMTLTPINIPLDTFKLRIEKTAIRRVPAEAFHLLSKLEFLWMSYNSVTTLSQVSFQGLHKVQELRLDGNILSSFPWKALAAMLQLRLLDLHNNKLSSVPKEAALYMKNITYLDLSSNKLITLPHELIASWLNFQADSYISSDYSKIILGLQDNPWICDCSLYDMVHFLNARAPFVAFIEPRLQCFAPQSLSGVLFSQVELRKCQSPVVHMSMEKMKVTVGNIVLLPCGSTGVPIPELSWRRADGFQINGTVFQAFSSDGMSSSILGLPLVSYQDSGQYICKAKNFLGATEDFIFLTVTDSDSIADQNGKEDVMGAADYDKLVPKHAMTSTITPSVATRPIHINSEQNSVLEHYKINAIEKPLNNGEPNTISNTCLVRALKVIGDTDHSISLAWKAPQTKHAIIFSILYAIFGEKEMHRINAESGKTKITIYGLMPKTKYIACVCMKGLIPKKEQCIIFSTDEASSASGTQKLINVVVISVACVTAVPLTVLVCCGALKRHCKKCLGRKAKDIQGSYVTFQSFSPGPKTKGISVKYLSTYTPDESKRLLSARSSVDSEALLKVEHQSNEYFC
ncbi:leucine-rich repeat, immunoglobulin-like domain and transmembrane domain-containing protein 1 [Microcaecilia unicolor]|uniref:leucine-rich repeat, immunoglobulin-like domain and transmembrane domain-containing protein 1 n=1 Tax=Microcaecilia unicolor TaxID=1415580 RepID=UPI00118470A6|nr:leucine-rich repeat, immunoglobulin-like domain and transmembrane domain-containing protein 1 [Microcaecilia unicolor]